MNAFVDLFDQTLERGLREVSRSETGASATDGEITRMSRFEREQIRGLLSQLFLQGPARQVQQVVFAPVDESTQADYLCSLVAQTLSQQVSGTVCLIQESTVGEIEQGCEDVALEPSRKGGLRGSSQQLSHNLWKTPASLLWGERVGGCSLHSLAQRMEELSLEFDYAILQAPPASTSGRAEMLGQLADGLVLVLRSSSTRRAAAISVKEKLSEGRVKILGTVLTERSFPIPEAIYRRL